MAEGWLIDADDHWVWRFHRDNSAWVRDPRAVSYTHLTLPTTPYV